jgi:hypothetical protein
MSKRGGDDSFAFWALWLRRTDSTRAAFSLSGMETLAQTSLRGILIESSANKK